MKINNFRTYQEDHLTKVAATLVWEDRNRSSEEIYIATTTEYAHDLSCNPNTFLLACTMLAFHYGEKRIFIDAEDAEICPELRDGLITSMHWMKSWYELDRDIVQIEAKASLKVANTNKPERSGMFFSGGIDTFATLRNNRLNFGSEHPGSIKDGFMVYGIANTNLEEFEKAFISLLPVAKDAGINLIPVYTNIYRHVKDLEDSNYNFWKYYFGGAALSAIAHAFVNRINLVYVASTSEIKYIEAWGSHPLTDPNYSSYDLRVKYDSVHLSRLDKTKLVADWDVAFQNLRVCDELVLPDGYLNCGVCYKCTITMAHLAALNVLDKTNVFPVKEMTRQRLIKLAHPKTILEKGKYKSLIPFFASIGRHDLVQAIHFILARSELKSNLQKVSKNFVGKKRVKIKAE